ncbi:hypothetical protein [Rufibacter immobilis]|uniref:hypothetical protein n=1 Tax=Rufibacter immobilis TaxID=1348778 RepID=UPI001C82F1D5|nr:hypothetical protein [Rufibacter immobilis]
MTFSACETKQAQETTTIPTVEEATNATDVAETTASPIDTIGMPSDSLGTDSIQ